MLLKSCSDAQTSHTAKVLRFQLRQTLVTNGRPKVGSAEATPAKDPSNLTRTPRTRVMDSLAHNVKTKSANALTCSYLCDIY
jgi:hypothetical protein